MGDRANVCLGTSEDGGSCCAVKFYHANEADEQRALAEDECKNWETAYRRQACFAMAYALDVAGGHCLVMPYLHPVKPEERLRLLDSGEIRNALEAFAESGFIHVEMQWRHIHIWRGKEESRIFIIDLENWSLKRCTNEVVVGKWIKRSIKHLRKTAKTKRKKNKQKNEQRIKHRRNSNQPNILLVLA